MNRAPSFAIAPADLAELAQDRVPPWRAPTPKEEAQTLVVVLIGRYRVLDRVIERHVTRLVWLADLHDIERDNIRALQRTQSNMLAVIRDLAADLHKFSDAEAAA